MSTIELASVAQSPMNAATNAVQFWIDLNMTGILICVLTLVVWAGLIISEHIESRRKEWMHRQLELSAYLDHSARAYAAAPNVARLSRFRSLIKRKVA